MRSILGFVSYQVVDSVPSDPCINYLLSYIWVFNSKQTPWSGPRPIDMLVVNPKFFICRHKLDVTDQINKFLVLCEPLLGNLILSLCSFKLLF